MRLGHSPVVILGMQRSGTSAVAGALARLGLFFGPEGDFFPADANNPAGYFELRALTVFNHKCLAFYQMPVASAWPLPSNWDSYPQGTILADELRTLLLKAFDGRPQWGLKQPVASLLIPLYSRVFEDLGLQPRYVVCIRNPLDIVASEAKWVYGARERQIPPIGPQAVAAWLQYTLGAMRAVQDSPYTLVPYHHFIEAPRDYLMQIVSTGQQFLPTDLQWQDAEQSVQARLRHHRASTTEFGSLPTLVRDVFDALCAGPKATEGFGKLHTEFELWQAMLQPPKLSGTRIGIAWNTPGGVRTAETPILPAGDWQTVRLTIDAPSRTLLNGLLYNKPCRIWIRRCAFLTAAGETRPMLKPGPGSQLAEINGILRLEGAYESQQINLVTPGAQGPYMLEMDILLESGLQIANDAVSRLADRLHQCGAKRRAPSNSARGPG